MATSVRVNCDCDDISNLPFSVRLVVAGRCTRLIKERANPGKLRKMRCWQAPDWRNFPTKSWCGFPSRRLGTFATPRRVERPSSSEGVRRDVGQDCRRVARREGRRPELGREGRGRSATARPRSPGAAFRRSRRWRSAAGHSGNARQAPARARPIPRTPRPRRRVLRRALEIGLDLALELDRHRLAVAVAALPAATRIQPSETQYSMTLVFSWPLNLMPTPRLKQRLVEMVAARIEREAVGRCVGRLVGHAGAPYPSPVRSVNARDPTLCKGVFTPSCRLADSRLSARRHMSDTT